MSWDEVFQRFRTYVYPHLRAESLVFGLPRGGVFVAAMTHCATDRLEHATLIVADVVNTGATAKMYMEMATATAFAALVDKKRNRDDKSLPFIVFPWDVR